MREKAEVEKEEIFFFPESNKNKAKLRRTRMPLSEVPVFKDGAQSHRIKTTTGDVSPPTTRVFED